MNTKSCVLVGEGEWDESTHDVCVLLLCVMQRRVAQVTLLPPLFCRFCRFGWMRAALDAVGGSPLRCMQLRGRLLVAGSLDRRLTDDL